MQINTKVDFANTLRGFAALSVVITHYFGVFWFGRDTVASFINAPVLSQELYPIPTPIIWLNKYPIFFNWGGYGIALFFLISGFVIPFSLQKGSGLGFCVNRFFRIVPTYIVGFSITLLCLYLSSKYFSKEWPYSLQEVWVHYLPGIRDIMWSRNIDGIVWTLEIEMKFYLVCALSIVWFRRYSLRVFLIPVVFFLLAMYLNNFMLSEWEKSNASAYRLTLTYIMSSQYIIFMFIGVMFNYLFCHKIDVNKGYLGVAGLFALYCLDWWAGPSSASFWGCWSSAFALLFFMFAYCFPRYFKSNPLFNFLANISYPLYVIHGVSGYVILRIMLDLGFKAWISLIIVLVYALTFSWLLHRFIEKPSQALGKKLGSKLSRKSLAYVDSPLVINYKQN